MKSLLGLILIGTAILFSACAKTEVVEKVNKTRGLALRGFDTVAYFAAQTAVEGNPQYEFVWNGAKWLFSSAENLKKFKQNPEAFAPQYGGFCSYTVSHGSTADGDPQTWKIVDDKLYLYNNPKAKEEWEQNQGQSISEGEKNWAEFQKK